MATRKISYREAINEALAQEMERDSTVILMGWMSPAAPEDRVRTMPGAASSV
jgi:hypothetical protein